jgi:hypothetical protein
MLSPLPESPVILFVPAGAGMEFEKLSDKHGRKMSKIAVLIILALIVLCSCRTEAFLKQRYTTFRHAPAKPVASGLVSHKLLPAERPEPLCGFTSEAESKERIPLASDQENLSAPHSFPGRGVAPLIRNIQAASAEKLLPVTEEQELWSREERSDTKNTGRMAAILDTLLRIVLFLILLAILVAVIIILILV